VKINGEYINLAKEGRHKIESDKLRRVGVERSDNRERSAS